MRRTVKLNERKLKRIINESIEDILNAGPRDVDLRDVITQAREILGDELLLDELTRAVGFAGNDSMREYMRYIDKNHELHLFE